jgi:ATP-dependent helicase/nuclease subunit A
MSETAEAEFIRFALDPARSVVVDACAGSGKTWLLVSRIIRLLLAGVPPAEILAITFTRKAAQEMRARLTEWLRILALAGDAEVTAFLRQRGIPDSERPAALARARGLFESCLTAQPGITIDTFHGWFLQLLERAPFNAEDATVPGNFVLEERISFLLDEAWDRFGALLLQPGNSGLAENFAALAAGSGYVNVRKLLGRFVSKRAEWWAYTRGHADPVAFALAELRGVLAVDPDSDPIRALLDDPAMAETLDRLAAVDARKSKTQAQFAQDIADTRGLSDPAQRFDGLFASCHTRQGTPSKNLVKFYDKQEAELRDRFEWLCARLREARDALEEIEVYRLHQSALPCAAGLLEIFQQLKRSRQIIDFTDIEWHAYRLLADGDDAAFMHAKLDSRYRHILLDEFQDTNPLQWQALRAWLDAYGRDAGRPTVFLVGDPKQSIYRFRRAEPRLFEVAAATLVQDYGAERLVTSVTRRCAPEIVAVVNAMFAGAPDYPDFPPHTSHPDTAPGRVEVLPLVRNPETVAAGEAPAWRNPLLEPLRDREDLRRNMEAATLAARISEIVGHWEVSAGKDGRPARYSDIMILKRSRTHLAAYEHALCAQGIPFLTSRHGGLLGTLEAADLCALIEVLIAPFDDLKLAHALRSPIFSCSDGDLVLLAQAAADGNSWWQCLTAPAGAASPALSRAQRLLADWRAAADTAPVHDLLDRIYHEGEVLARYRAACPAATRGQVTANLQRFLELALELDSGRYPSLPRFVAELAQMRAAPDQEAPDEGREAGAEEAGVGGDETLDAVRVFTIHGAKGLEAPVVWLIDARDGQRTESYDVLVDWPPAASAPRHFSLYTVNGARGRRRDPFFDTQSELAAQERLNLLYVAATRAERYLFVSGIEAERGAGAASQAAGPNAYDRLAAGVAAVADAQAGAGALVVGKAATTPPVAANAATSGTPGAAPMAAPAPATRGAGARLVQNAAGRFGSLLHRVLEYASVPPAPERPAVRRALALSEAEFAPVWEQASALLGAPQLRRFYDASQFLRAENELEVLAGTDLKRIDRLVEFDDEVWILDYKSGADERAAWRVQLANYRTILKPLFAQKKLRTAVVLADGSLEEFES